MMTATQESGMIPRRVTKYYAYNLEGMYLSTLYLEPEDVPQQTNVTDVAPEFKDGFIPWFDGEAWVNREFLSPATSVEP